MQRPYIDVHSVSSLVRKQYNPYCTVNDEQRYSDWLRAGRSGDRILVGTRFFVDVQTDPGAHSASCTMGTGSFPGLKRPGRVADDPPPSSAEVKKSSVIPLPHLRVFGSVMGYLYFK
jgi:hypothetical protein